MSFATLPLELVHHIMTYDKRFVLRRGELLHIGAIDITRFSSLLSIPKKQILEDNIPEVWLPIPDSVNAFCLMATNDNGEPAIELQKLAHYNGNTYVLDIQSHRIL